MNNQFHNDGGLLDHYKSELDEVIDNINDAIYNHLKRELTLIHSQHFFRHQIRFVDAMGMVSISIGNYVPYKYGYVYERFGHIFQELFDLIDWYLKCGELHKDICIDDIIIDPITR